MRIYFGIGKRINIKTIIQILGFAFVALCAFFGIDKITAHAAVVSVNPNGSSVNAYKPQYSNSWDDTNLNNGGTCSPSNISGCSSKTGLYNSSSCNNQTSNGTTFCMFANHNSNNYFSIANGINSGSNYMFASPYVITYGYYPHSKLVWTWAKANVNYCSSGTLKLLYQFRFTTNNTALTTANLCAQDLNTVTGSIGYCSNYVTVNGNDYQGTLESGSTYSVIIPKPTTDLSITIPDIQPFLKTFTPEGQTTTGYYWNYGFAITGYECNATSDNTDSNAIINNASQNTQSINNNITNSTNSINQNINNGASAIVDTIEDLQESNDENTQSLIDSQKVCFDRNINKDNVSLSPGYLNSSGTVTANDNYYHTTDYIDITNSSNITINNTRGNNASYCLYDTNKTLISCTPYNGQSSVNVSISSNVYFIRFSLYTSSYPTYLTFRQCKNGNQAIWDSIKDDSGTTYSSSPFDTSFMREYPSEIQTIIMYPMNLIQLMVNSAQSDTCDMLELDLSPITQRWGGFDYTFRLPCMRDKVKSLIGNDWYNTLDTIIGWSLFFYFCCNLYLKIEDYTSGVDMFPSFFVNSRNKKIYVDNATGEVIR